jgi:predicted nucleic acid-binding protein
MILIFDTGPLGWFAKAGRLDLLERLTSGWERTVPRAVLDELEAGVSKHPELERIQGLPWIERVAVDSLEELRAFAYYANRLGAGSRNIGEASVLAWAEVHGAAAFIDDQVAVQCGRDRGVEVHRTLATIASGVRDGLLSPGGAEEIVDQLRLAGAWFPCNGAEFVSWARGAGILP